MGLSCYSTRMNLRALLSAFVPLFLMLGCSSESADLGDLGSGGAIASGGRTESGGATSDGGTNAGGAQPSPAGGVASASGGTTSGGAASGGQRSTGGAPQGSGGTRDSSGGSGGTSDSTGGGSPGSGGNGEGECPFSGQITYTLSRAENPSADEEDAYARITAALDKALSIYNCYTEIEKALNIQYNPSVATADGNPNGSIRFGSRASMNFVTAMHEISHVLGVGADGAYDPLIISGVYTGPIATARLRELTQDETAEIHGDAQHFWPYGLNYESEYVSEEDGIFHCYIVTAMRKDIGWD